MRCFVSDGVHSDALSAEAKFVPLMGRSYDGEIRIDKFQRILLAKGVSRP